MQVGIGVLAAWIGTLHFDPSTRDHGKVDDGTWIGCSGLESSLVSARYFSIATSIYVAGSVEGSRRFGLGERKLKWQRQ